MLLFVLRTGIRLTLSRLIVPVPAFRHKLFIVLFALLNGYSQLCASTGSKTGTLIKNHKVSEYTGLCTASTSGALFIKYSSFGTEKQNYRPDESFFEIEEDDELVSFKKHLENGSYTASIFFAQARGYFFNFNRKVSPSFQHVYTNSSCLYLVVQVFRI